MKWKKSITDNEIISEGTRDVINNDIREAFDPLMSKLRSFNIEINDDNTIKINESF